MSPAKTPIELLTELHRELWFDALTGNSAALAAARIVLAVRVALECDPRSLDVKNGPHGWARAYLRRTKMPKGMDHAVPYLSINNMAEPTPNRLDVIRMLVALADQFLRRIGLARSVPPGLTETQAWDLFGHLNTVLSFQGPHVFGAPLGKRPLNVPLPLEELKKASKRDHFDGTSAVRVILVAYCGGTKAASTKVDHWLRPLRSRRARSDIAM